MRNQSAGLAVLQCLMVLGLAGCGGSSSSNGPTPMAVTLSPSSVSVVVNASAPISLQSPTQLPKYISQVDWNIQEYGSNTACVEVSLDPPNAPPIPNCASGWLAIVTAQTGYTSTSATYFAPSAPTSAHVVANVKFYTDYTQSTISSQGSGTSAITVTSQ